MRKSFALALAASLALGPFAAAAEAAGPTMGSGMPKSHKKVKGFDAPPTCFVALLAPRWLVTAAHCVVDMAPNRSQVSIPAQGDKVGLQMLNVDRVIVHPDYAKDPARNDLALLHLTDTVKGNKVKKASIAQDTMLTPARTVGGEDQYLAEESANVPAFPVPPVPAPPGMPQMPSVGMTPEAAQAAPPATTVQAQPQAAADTPQVTEVQGGLVFGLLGPFYTVSCADSGKDLNCAYAPTLIPALDLRLMSGSALCANPAPFLNFATKGQPICSVAGFQTDLRLYQAWIERTVKGL